jgi:hypothetical protein
MEQEKFDKVKWYDSILVGYDRCGSYDFCAECDKTQSDPCARAMQKFNTPNNNAPNNNAAENNAPNNNAQEDNTQAAQKPAKKRIRIGIIRFRV